MGVDAVCVRGAACEPGTGLGRFGQINAAIVRELVATIPSEGEPKPIPAAEERPAEGPKLLIYWVAGDPRLTIQLRRSALADRQKNRPNFTSPAFAVYSPIVRRSF